MRYKLLLAVLIAFIALAGQAWAWEQSWGHIFDEYCTDSDCALYLSFDDGAVDHSPYNLDLTLPGLHLHEDDQEDPDINSAAADNDWNTYATTVTGFRQSYIIPDAGVTEINITWKFELNSNYEVSLRVYNFSSDRWVTIFSTSTSGNYTVTKTIKVADYGITNKVITSHDGANRNDYEEKISYLHNSTLETGKYGYSLAGDYAYGASTGNIINNYGFLEYTALLIGNFTPATGTQYLFGYYYYTGWGEWLPALDFELRNGELITQYWDTYQYTDTKDVTNEISYGNVSGWACVAVTYKTATTEGNTYADGIKAYLNGQLVNKNTTGAHGISTMNISVGRKVGAINNNASFSVSRIDEVIVFRRVLDAKEIRDICRQAWISIFAVDEDTNEQIKDENLTTYLYDRDSGLIVAKKSSPAPVRFKISAPERLLITAYTNVSYTNQRRTILQLPTPPGEENISIYLLKNGRGISQLIRVFDRSSYNPIQEGEVYINYSNNTIDYGVTDTQGRLWSYLDPYKLYTVKAYKPGYQTATYQLTPSLNEFIIYLRRLFEKPPKPKFVFNPRNAILNVNNTYIPMVSIENYKELQAVTFTVAKSRAHYEYYMITGQQQTGVVESETFSMTDLSWCNSTYLCSYNDQKITFRYSQSLLNDFGDYVLVIYNYTTRDGEKLTEEKTYMFSDFKINQLIAGMFTDSQKPWVGLGIIIFGTFSVVSSMVRWGFNPTVRQIAFIVYIFIIVDYIFGFFPASYLVLSTLILLGAILGGRAL